MSAPSIPQASVSPPGPSDPGFAAAASAQPAPDFPIATPDDVHARDSQYVDLEGKPINVRMPFTELETRDILHDLQNQADNLDDFSDEDIDSANPAQSLGAPNSDASSNEYSTELGEVVGDSGKSASSA